MTWDGSPRTRFQRAIRARSLYLAELAARDMGAVSLDEALALVVLYGEAQDPKYVPAAVRLVGRVALERGGVTLGTVIALASALDANDPRWAEQALRSSAV